MALPGDVLSTTPVPSALIAPDGNLRLDLREDFERGGIALNDPSAGLAAQTWRGWTDGETIFVAPLPGLTPTTAVTTGIDITEVALAFDQNMEPTLAYIDGGLTKLRWYDTLTAAIVTTDFAGLRSPLLSMDDKREGANSYNDIIFGYIRDDQVRYRQQRDRYSIEYTLGAVPGTRSRLLQLGMGTNNRMQFKVSSPPAASYTDLLTDTLFVVSAFDVLPVHGGDLNEATWRSKTFVLDEQPTFGWARVEGEYPAVVRFFGDGLPYYTSPPITNAKPFRIPARRFREWAIELVGSAPVVAVAMAQDVEELL